MVASRIAIVLAAALALSAAPEAVAKLQLHVAGLENGSRFGSDQVFDGFGCSGGNRSPSLRIGGVPAETQSLAVTIHDADAPTQSGWWHWLAYDLPPQTRHLAVGAGAEGGAGLPAGARQAPNDFGARAYGGACPPAGDPPHRYRITAWALRVPRLDAPAGASAALVDFQIGANDLARDTVVAQYGRNP
jgi:Raf kinase inhibitor-like YbhB/YbcL family protein